MTTTMAKRKKNREKITADPHHKNEVTEGIEKKLKERKRKFTKL